MTKFAGVVIYWKGYDARYGEDVKLSYKKLAPQASYQEALANARLVFDEMCAKRHAFDEDKDNWNKGPVAPDQAVLYAASPLG